MILGVDGGVVALVALVLVVGATVQALVGLGLGLVAAPVVTILDPALMPELLLVLAASLPLLTLVGSHDEIDWRGLAWVLPARVPGTAVGVFFLAQLFERYLGVAVAFMVLLAVLFTVGAAMSLVGIWLGGTFEVRVFLLALLLTPCLALGAFGRRTASRSRPGPPDQVRRTGGVCRVSVGAARA